MGWMIRAGSLLVFCAALGGCITTSEMPLAKNVWQIHTETGGSLFTGQADKATLRRAAELTLAQGYSHFVIQNPQTQTGSSMSETRQARRTRPSTSTGTRHTERRRTAPAKPFTRPRRTLP